MSSALDDKSRNVLTEGQITILAMLYSSLKGHEFMNEEVLNEDLKDTHRFLDALGMCGFAVLTQSAIDEIWNALMKERKKL
jgi:hypothetical protein